MPAPRSSLHTTGDVRLTIADGRIAILVLRCQAGDEGAFGQLYGSYGPRTLGYLRGLIGADAEDVQQDVWLKAYRGLHGLADPGAFQTWLFRLTRHGAIDYLRRRKRVLNLLVDQADTEAVPDPGPRPDELSDTPLADGLLEQLPVLQREALGLRYRDGLSYAEIALIAGCSLGTVRSRLFYGRRRLMELMQDDKRNAD